MSDLAALDPVVSAPGQPLYAVVRDRVHGLVDEGVLQPGQRLPSTKALSQRFEVSLVTVHRALNELVSSGVLRRGQGRGTFVHEDYANPSHIAGALRFGLVFQHECKLADQYHGHVLQGVRDASAEMGIDLVLLRYGEDWRRECSGFLYVNPFPDQLSHSPQFGSGSSGRGSAPIVAIGVAPESAPGVAVVDTDNVAMTRRAVEMLWENGHRRIAYLGDGSRSSNSVDRAKGFEEGRAACGVQRCGAFDDLPLGWRMSDEGIEQLAGIMTSSDRPTAIVAGGYYLALDVYDAAKRAGVRIPDDVSVTGIDDPPSAAHLSPSLTTFAQPLEEVGRRAVQVLKSWIDAPSTKPESVTLRASLCERESVAPLAAQDARNAS